MLAKLSVLLCLAAAAATVAFVLPGEYLRLTFPDGYVLLAALVGPYLVLGLFAWFRRGEPRAARALFLLTALLTLVSLYLLGTDAAGYRSAVSASPRGPEYMKERYPRMAVFLVPVVQWLVVLLAGGSLLVGARRGRKAGKD